MADIDPAAVYRETRHRLRDLLADPADAAVSVPACPAWTVADTIAHVIGIADDFRAGRLEDLGSDAWTAAQVEPRRGRSLADLFEEWEGLDAFMHRLATDDPWMGTRLVADLVTHEHDIRGALGRPGARDSAAVMLGLERYAPSFAERAAEAGLGPVTVHAGDRTWGPDTGAVLELHGSPFDVLRALTGRRSRAQVLALDWRGADPGRYVALVSPYGQRAHDLVE
jgi:uncharacterized protein (TIGR03083 family)